MSTTDAQPAAGRMTTRGTTLGFVVLLLAIGALTGLAMLVVGPDSAVGISGGITASLPMTAAGIAVTAYIAAAATGIRWMGWVWAAVGAVLVTATELLHLERWIVLAVALGVVAVVGLVLRTRATVPQVIAGVAYFGLAVLALLLDPRVGLAVAGLVLASHTAWDWLHFRRDAVVNRSLALWCMGLDLVVGLGCVAIAVAG